jgi:hypothetical protein
LDEGRRATETTAQQSDDDALTTVEYHALDAITTSFAGVYYDEKIGNLIWAGTDGRGARTIEDAFAAWKQRGSKFTRLVLAADSIERRRRSLPALLKIIETQTQKEIIEMSLDKTILDSLASKAAEDWNQKHVLGRPPKYGEPATKLTGVWSEMPKFLLSALEVYTEKKIKPLLKRIEELEARPELKYHGVWSAGKTYAENSLVTHSGSLWIAKKTTAAYPGGNAEPGSWQLCVKRGADGKDGKGAA